MTIMLKTDKCQHSMESTEVYGFIMGCTAHMLGIGTIEKQAVRSLPQIERVRLILLNHEHYQVTPDLEYGGDVEAERTGRSSFLTFCQPMPIVLGKGLDLAKNCTTRTPEKNGWELLGALLRVLQNTLSLLYTSSLFTITPSSL